MLLLVAFSVVCLIAIKGRYILAFTAAFAALLPLLELRVGWRRLALYAGVVCVAAYALGAVLALGGTPALGSMGDTLFAYGTLDAGGSDLATLTGRTPLWEELGRYFAAQPWLGYGFGAFWNPEFMPAIWSVVGWDAPVAHNGFIDEALATGVIGLFLFLVLWLTGIWYSIRLRVVHGDADAILVIAFMAFFLACNAGDSLMQTYARFPFYVSLTALFTLLGARRVYRRSQSVSRIAPLIRPSEVSNRPREGSALPGMTTSPRAKRSNP
jgi:O-antigen ligase